jgi:hypothetical protein
VPQGCFQSKPAAVAKKHVPSGFENALAKAVGVQVFEGGVKPTSITKILMNLPKLGAKLMLVRGA